MSRWNTVLLPRWCVPPPSTLPPRQKPTEAPRETVASFSPCAFPRPPCPMSCLCLFWSNFFCFLPLSLAPRSSSSLLSNHITLLSDDERVAWIPFPEQQAQSAQKNWEAQARTNSILAGSLKALEERVDDCATLLDWYVVVSSKPPQTSSTQLPPRTNSLISRMYFSVFHVCAPLYFPLY